MLYSYRDELCYYVLGHLHTRLGLCERRERCESIDFTGECVL